jgi:microsomal dipeptidase-like Zn-dependent dipeptidase
MLVDLHAHFPMHLLPEGRQRTHQHVRAFLRRRWQARIVDLISRVANYQGPGGMPSVTESLMRDGNVKVALSVLYAPFSEMDLTQSYGAPPQESYFSDVVAELELVEDYVAAHGTEVAIAHSPAELDAFMGDPRPVLIHAIEGGFQLGADEAEVRKHVSELADRGVAYVTVAHLFWRKVATSAPALPFLPDWLYHVVFPQPHLGLTDLGRAAVEAMADHGILIDMTHMSARARDETFALLDRRDPDKRIPVIASHMAYRFGKLEYSFDDEVIRRVAERGGVLGCILSEHYITNGLPNRVRSFADSVNVLCRHIDRIRDITGSFAHVAIGSDLDGYIKPALPGLEHMGRMRDLQQSLSQRYGPDAELITSGNALRVLRSGWRSAPAASRPG